MTISKRFSNELIPSKKYGSFAQMTMYSKKPKENTDDAKIGDCKTANQMCMSEKGTLESKGDCVNESLPE